MSAAALHLPSETARRSLYSLASAAAFTLLTLSIAFISGAGQYWISLAGDAAQGQIGWSYFARDVWRFPIFAIQNYHLPEGSNLILSDGIPALAILVKPIYQLFFSENSAPPVYMGLWVALCFFLQVVATLRLLSSLEIVRPSQKAAALVLFCYVPFFFLRFGHFSLLGQFILLLSLDFYIRATRENPKQVPRYALAIPGLTLWIHPYLAAMSGLIFAATLIEQWRRSQLSGRNVFIRMVSIFLVAFIVMFVGGGYLDEPGRGFRDYGLYSLNLLSPFIPVAGTSLGMILRTDTPTAAGLYQWEGACYLGAGVIFLSLFAAISIRNWRRLLHRHAALLAILLLTLIFAISNKIGLGSKLLLDVPLPNGVLDALSKFRGSGRFVWISVYVLTAFICLAVVRNYSYRSSLTLLVFAALLQLADVFPMQRSVRAATMNGAASTIKRDAWSSLIARHSRVFEFPSFECGGVFLSDVPGSKWRALEIDYLAAREGKPNNSAYLARYTKNCDRERADAAIDVLSPGTLYIYRNTDDVGQMLSAHAGMEDHCGYLDDVVICSSAMDLTGYK